MQTCYVNQGNAFAGQKIYNLKAFTNPKQNHRDPMLSSAGCSIELPAF